MTNKHEQLIPRRTKAAQLVLAALEDLRDSESVNEITKAKLLRFMKSEYRLPARYTHHVDAVLKNGVGFGVIARNRGKYSLSDSFNMAKRRRSKSRSRRHRRGGSRRRRRRRRRQD